MPIEIIIIAIAAFIFLLGQTIQAVSISILIGILAKLFHPMLKRSSSRRSDFRHGFAILNLALFFLLVNTLAQIGIWAISFVLVGQFSNYWEAFYFSTVTFATLGYGDVVMQPPWRLLGALEAVSGALMLGLSAATLSNVFGKLLLLRRKR